jgi:hypothetical protein
LREVRFYPVDRLADTSLTSASLSFELSPLAYGNLKVRHVMEAKSLLLPPRYTPPSRYSHEVTADQAIILPFNFLGSGFCAFMAEEPVTYQINPLFQFSCVLEKAVLALISETAGTYRRIHDDDLPAPAPAPAMERKVS